MKTLIVNGSYKKDGVTAALVESFKKGLLSGDPQAEIKTVNLIDTPIEFCKGCGACRIDTSKNIGECDTKDGTENILKEMLEADSLVLATPIYMFTHTALMKRFLERCLPLLKPGKMGPPVSRNAPKKGKRGLVILSTGAPYPINTIMGFTANADNLLSRISRAAACEKIFRIKCGGFESSEKAKQKFLKEAYAAGVKLGKSN